MERRPYTEMKAMEKLNKKRIDRELAFSTVLMIIYRLTEYLEPLVHRKIHQEELWLYKNPRTDSYVPNYLNWIICSAIPLITYGGFYFLQKSKQDFVEATLGTYFSASFTGAITNVFKNLACRPRPDFFERCFPDGRYMEDMPNNCTGERADVIEGLKSFPSGHASLAFACLGFTSLYWAGKLQCFSSKGKQPWRLTVASLPVLLAGAIAVSRTADYHHHWQDVLVGSILGLVISYVAYRQRYPAVSRAVSHLPHISVTPMSSHLQMARQESVISPHITDHQAQQDYMLETVKTV